MAITASDVEVALAPVIGSRAGGEAVLLGDAGLFVTVPAFVELFGGATALTGADLKAIDNGTLGYGEYIDAWVAAGYIPAS